MRTFESDFMESYFEEACQSGSDISVFGFTGGDVVLMASSKRSKEKFLEIKTALEEFGWVSDPNSPISVSCLILSSLGLSALSIGRILKKQFRLSSSFREKKLFFLDGLNPTLASDSDLFD